MHGHLEDEIMEAIDSNDLEDTTMADLGLDALPVVVGIADGEPPASARGPGFPTTNWAGNILWSAADVALPESIDELCALVQEAEGRVRVVGRSHSFTPAADTDGLLMSMVRMQDVLDFDDEAGTITVEGGTTYTVINDFLKDKNWAVKNLATLPHFTVAGSASMGTHGSSGVGDDGRAKLGNQASQISAIEFVLPDGSLRSYDASSEVFAGVGVALGCLGPISKITLDLTPRYNVVQAVYIDISLDSVLEHFREMVESVDSFSWLVDWPRREESADMAALEGVLGRNRLLVRTFVDPDVTTPPELPEERWGGRLYDPETMGEAIQSSGLVVGPWFDLMNTYGAGLPMSSEGGGRGTEEDGDAYGLNGTYETREVQVEYFVPLDRAEEALAICAEVCGKWSYDVFLITELRAIRGDEMWLSPTRDTDSLVIHFSMNKHNIPGVIAASGELEAALAPLGCKPHWGKLHHMGHQTLTGEYGEEAMEKFRALCLDHDPEGVYRNEWFERLIFGESEDDHLSLVLPAEVVEQEQE